MMGENSIDDTVTILGIISINLLPLLGIIFFSWETDNLLFVLLDTEYIVYYLLQRLIGILPLQTYY